MNASIGLLLYPLLDTIVVVFMIYAVTMLQILRYRFETLTDDVNDMESINSRDPILRRKLREYVIAQLEVRR